jgi:chemotaxis signal transduction protein
VPVRQVRRVRQVRQVRQVPQVCQVPQVPQVEQRVLQLSESLLVLALQLFCSQLLQEIKKRRIA